MPWPRSTTPSQACARHQGNGAPRSAGSCADSRFEPYGRAPASEWAVGGVSRKIERREFRSPSNLTPGPRGALLARLPADHCDALLGHADDQVEHPGYFENRWFGVALDLKDFFNVPTGVAVFANQVVDDGAPPREWAERLYNVR